MIVNGNKSNICQLEVVVPQGSILGSLLYIMYVNDILNSLSCSARLYADDTCLVLRDNDYFNYNRKSF